MGGVEDTLRPGLVKGELHLFAGVEVLLLEDDSVLLELVDLVFNVDLFRLGVVMVDNCSRR